MPSHERHDMTWRAATSNEKRKARRLQAQGKVSLHAVAESSPKSGRLVTREILYVTPLEKKGPP